MKNKERLLRKSRSYFYGESEMEERKIKTVTLTLTQACNLSCTYCYEHHKSNRRMSVETAKSIVDYELKNFADFEGKCEI